MKTSALINKTSCISNGLCFLMAAKIYYSLWWPCPGCHHQGNLELAFDEKINNNGDASQDYFLGADIVA